MRTARAKKDYFCKCVTGTLQKYDINTLIQDNYLRIIQRLVPYPTYEMLLNLSSKGKHHEHFATNAFKRSSS